MLATMYLLVFFLLIQAAVKHASSPFRWSKWLLGLSIALFLGISFDMALSQSRMVLNELIDQGHVLNTLAVLICIESFVLVLSLFFTPEGKNRILKGFTSVTEWVPGVMIFPAVFYMQIQLFYLFPGYNYTRVNYVAATGLGILLPVTALLIQRLLPYRNQQKELLYVSSIVSVLLVMILVNEYNQSLPGVPFTGTEHAFYVLLVMFATVFIGGLYDKVKPEISITSLWK